MRTTRIILALLFYVGVTLLFLDFTGTAHAWLGWMARVQFLPALLALNIGVVAALVALTLVLGRVYCSVVCPLGVMQDIVSWVRGRRKKKLRYRFGYTPERRRLRYGVLAVFVVLTAAGLTSIAALIAPYSAYGRIAQNLLSPLWIWGNNALAYLAERAGSYAFYEKEVWLRTVPVFAVAVATLAVIATLAWRGGRTWCNTICPVGTMLGLLSRFAWLKPVIDTGKCNGCGLCGKGCKASCIDTKNHKIDYSRCVACMDCIDNCRQGAMHLGTASLHNETQNPENLTPSLLVRKQPKNLKPKNLKPNSELARAQATQISTSRRSFLAGTAMLATALAVKAQEKKVDGGLAAILDKEKPERDTPITPSGSVGHWHVARHCTGCQLCIAACPNDVLRPSTAPTRFMQPECSYERGYCRPECTRCSEVCPTEAIHRITVEEKSAIQVGHAVWVRKNCVVLTDDVDCGNCARHCPTGAILMVPSVEGDKSSRKIPAIDTERCIGCGACEHLCPARPFSAIYVEGHEVHREV